jgi:hypothetical protein
MSLVKLMKTLLDSQHQRWSGHTLLQPLTLLVRQLVQGGRGADKVWEDVCNQLKEKAIPALEKQHPNCQLLFIFDNSSGHASFASDALVAGGFPYEPRARGGEMLRG